MPRPVRCRRVCLSPDCTYFKPAGVPTSALAEVVVTVDELEALRLADVEGLYHEQAADRMRVSRRTFGRIINSAHRKVAQALIKGMALRIERRSGRDSLKNEERTFCCADCDHRWQVPFGTGRPSECPQCQSKNFHRVAEERGGGGRRRGRGGSRGSDSAFVGADAGTPDEPKGEAKPVARKKQGRQNRQRRRRRGAST